jgi:hypothetical protein
VTCGSAGRRRFWILRLLTTFHRLLGVPVDPSDRQRRLGVLGHGFAVLGAPRSSLGVGELLEDVATSAAMVGLAM